MEDYGELTSERKKSIDAMGHYELGGFTPEISKSLGL